MVSVLGVEVYLLYDTGKMVTSWAALNIRAAGLQKVLIS